MYIFRKEVDEMKEMIQGYLDILAVNGSLCWHNVRHRQMDCDVLRLFIARKFKEGMITKDIALYLYKIISSCE